MYAIIGNGIPTRNYTTEIDACARIVRFQKLNHFATGLTSTRHDILASRNYNHGDHVKALASGLIPRHAFAAKEVWLLGDRWTRLYVESYDLELASLKIIPQFFIDRIVRETRKHAGKPPSTGFLTLRYLEEVIGADQLRLFGFGYGTFGTCEPLDYERGYVSRSFEVVA